MPDPNERRQERWRRLDGLLQRLERKGIAALKTDEVKDFCRLYRQATIDLSQARANSADPQMLQYLNRLASRAHSFVYTTKRLSLRPFYGFLLTGFPAVLRRQWRAMAAAGGIFLLTSAITCAAVLRQPELAYSLFDENTIEFENMRLEKHEGEYRGNFTFAAKQSPVVAAQIIGNNVRVAVMGFAFGSLCCLPGLLLLTYNGRMLGALTGVIGRHGYAFDFYSLVMTHGVLELSAICIASGSGLLLGWAVIHPGPRTRRAALREAAKDAFSLLAGSVVMLVFAGIIEAYITPHYGRQTRWSVAAGSLVLMLLYFAFAGRRSAKAPAEALEV